jgi:hypothetical protein
VACLICDTYDDETNYRIEMGGDKYRRNMLELRNDTYFMQNPYESLMDRTGSYIPDAGERDGH